MTARPLPVALVLAGWWLACCGGIAAAQGSLSLSQPTGRVVYQRAATNAASVTVAGTYTGGPSRIEARAMPMPGFAGTATGWQVIDSGPAGGSFASELIVPAGWYRIETRTLDGSGELATAAIDRVGVGEVFVTAGQSNSANYGSPPQTPSDERVSALTATLGWRLASDPQPRAGGSSGSPWPAFGDSLAATLDVPVGIIAVGIGSTTVGSWQPGGTNYTTLQTVLGELGPGGLRAVLWHQGESDSLAGTSAAAYQSSLEAIIAQSRVDAGFDVPWGVALASYHPNASAANEARVIDGQTSVIAADPLVFQGAATDAFGSLGYLSDGVHFNQQGLTAHGDQWADAVRGNLTFPVPEPGTGIALAMALLAGGWYVNAGRKVRHAARQPGRKPEQGIRLS